MSPIITDHSLELMTHSPKQTFLIGQRLGRLLRPGDVVCLQGELGTGKTCLTQGIGAGLNVAAKITSPTFVLVNEYPAASGGARLYHVDLYRIEDPASACALGLEDYFYGDGVTVVEWAERARELVPAERLWITLSYLGHTKRSLLLEAAGRRYLEVLASLRAELTGGKGHRSEQEDA